VAFKFKIAACVVRFLFGCGAQSTAHSQSFKLAINMIEYSESVKEALD
jgi:hypothetical protein